MDKRKNLFLACRAINRLGLDVDGPVTIDYHNQYAVDVIEDFIDAVETIDDAGLTNELSEFVVEFYEFALDQDREYQALINDPRPLYDKAQNRRNRHNPPNRNVRVTENVVRRPLTRKLDI